MHGLYIFKPTHWLDKMYFFAVQYFSSVIIIYLHYFIRSIFA